MIALRERDTRRRVSLKRSKPLQPASDEELFLRYRDDGDQAAFDHLVHRYQRELLSYLRRHLGNPQMAEDVFQTTFLQVYRKAHLYEAGRRFRPWLYAVATHQAIDALRKAGRHHEISLDGTGPNRAGEHHRVIDFVQDDRPGPVEQVELEERRNWTRQAVAELPSNLRSAILLIYYRGLKYREVAEILGVPEGTLKTWIHSALIRLNKAWQENLSKQNEPKENMKLPPTRGTHNPETHCLAK